MTYLMAQSSNVILAASGQDAVLAGELRSALVAAGLSYAEALRQCSGPEEWIYAARRLVGLAGSFGALQLQRASANLLDQPVGDEAALAQIDLAIAALQDIDLQIG